MNKQFVLIAFFVIAFWPKISSSTETNHLTLDFSNATAEENKVTLQGAGFGAYPEASVKFGYIPTDNAFDGATDGHGLIITAKPGEGVMVFGQRIDTTQAALIRCSVRTDRPVASVIIATIGDEPDVFVSQNTPTNPGYFTGQYLRLQTLYSPPATGFQPVIQIVNTDTKKTVTAYLDNFEIFLLDTNRYYNSVLLDGDLVDPATEKISIPIDNEAITFSPGDSSISILIDATHSISVEMALIHNGTFMMGSPIDEEGHCTDEGQPHPVTLTDDFYLGKYEVTQEQWTAVMGKLPDEYNSSTVNYGVGPNYPIYYVAWNDCLTFIEKLNLLKIGTFRFPTEAEWEYACRAETTAAYYWEDKTKYDTYAWCKLNSNISAHPVGSKVPNNWGLYDMSGNILEWCLDMYNVNYNLNDQKNPIGTDNSDDRSFRVLRGGCLDYDLVKCRSAYRAYSYPAYKSYYTGLRLAWNN